MPGLAARISGLVRLAHPFPSLLTSSATAGIAALAGGDGPAIVRLFFAMLGIQVSIGALNDVADAPRDAVAKPRKPIPAGLVPPRLAVAVAGGGTVLGLVLSGVSGGPTALVGAGCIALGWAYDLRLSRTAISWLPLSLALPLLPIHAWLGATGSLPDGMIGLIPLGVLAGAGLAIANGLVDAERDAGTGRAAIVVRLGLRRAWLVQTVLLAAAAMLALCLTPSGGGPGEGSGGSGLPGSVRAWAIVIGCVAVAMGAIVIRSRRPGVRERGWELEAVGVAGLGIGWLAGVSTLGGP